MRGWPVAAGVLATLLVLAVAILALAPSFVALCDGAGRRAACDPLLGASRTLLVGFGAVLAAALIAVLYAVLLARKVSANERDARPLVPIRGRRRH